RPPLAAPLPHTPQHAPIEAPGAPSVGVQAPGECPRAVDPLDVQGPGGRRPAPPSVPVRIDVSPPPRPPEPRASPSHDAEESIVPAGAEFQLEPGGRPPERAPPS